MPELPEVHTTVSGLKKVLPNKAFTCIWSDWPKMLKNTSLSRLEKIILNKKVVGVERMGKNIIINISGGSSLIIHMKMTGHLLFGEYTFDKKKNRYYPKLNGPLKDPYNRFIHFVFKLSDGNCLSFCDSRKFGSIDLIETSKLHLHRRLGVLGPEPISKEFSFVDFKKALHKKSRGKIKQILMDQSVLSGIGNIYSDEILFETGIHPEEKVSKINDTKMKTMYTSMRKILMKGIDFGGDSMSDYRNIYGEKGKFQEKHKVYRKVGEKCSKKNCNGKICRIKVGGRSAHFCDVHQKLLGK